MDIRLLGALMVIAIVMDLIGRLSRRRIAEAQDAALEGEREGDAPGSLMESWSDAQEAAVAERAGGSDADEGMAGAGVAGDAGARPEGGALTPRASEPGRPPSILELLTGVAVPTVDDLARTAVEVAQTGEVVAAAEDAARRKSLSEAPPRVAAGQDPGPAPPSSRRQDSEERPQRAPGPLPAPATVRRRHAVIRPRLKGDMRLREAIVVREILGPPVALRSTGNRQDATDIG